MSEDKMKLAYKLACVVFWVMIAAIGITLLLPEPFRMTGIITCFVLFFIFACFVGYGGESEQYERRRAAKEAEKQHWKMIRELRTAKEAKELQQLRMMVENDARMMRVVPIVPGAQSKDIHGPLRTCPNCGQSLPLLCLECPKCGRHFIPKLPKYILTEIGMPDIADLKIPVPPLLQSTVRLCPNCGHENTADDVFCTECGAKL
jgi:hypothetical protein